MPITTGTVLGRYRLLERAGTGGMSEVWKAEDETLKRTVAIKVILGPVAQDPTFRERFLREARLVAGLEHPNVLPVYDYGSATVGGEDVSYLVMPLVAGGSLKGRISGPIPPALAVAWLAAIASALDHAHAKGILHRDIKPANVLMDSQGRPLLADFGLARSSDATSGLTATGTVMGTPLYMAPEQATGGALDGRADEYALGVVAFELLSGRVPFIADSPLAVLHQQVTAPPPPLSIGPPGQPSGGGRRPREGAREEGRGALWHVRRVRARARRGARRSERGGDGSAGGGRRRRVATPDGRLAGLRRAAARRARVRAPLRASTRRSGRCGRSRRSSS